MNLFIILLSILIISTNGDTPELKITGVFCDPVMSSKPVKVAITNDFTCSGCSGGQCADIVWFDLNNDPDACWYYMKCVVVKQQAPNSEFDTQLWIKDTNNPNVIRMDIPYSPTPAPTTPSGTGTEVTVTMYDDQGNSGTITWTDYDTNVPPLFHLGKQPVTESCYYENYKAGLANRLEPQFLHCGRSDPANDIVVSGFLQNLDSFDIEPTSYSLAVLHDFGGNTCNFINGKIINVDPAADGAFCLSNGETFCNDFYSNTVAPQGRITITRPSGSELFCS